MRKYIWLFLLGSLLLVACGGGKPQINLETNELKLGDVVNGEIVSREVKVDNTGQAELVIEYISTSCGCTKATLEPMTVAPGGQATLTVTFDSGAHGPEENGELVRQVFIASNDPMQPDVVLELTANVLPAAAP